MTVTTTVQNLTSAEETAVVSLWVDDRVEGAEAVVIDRAQTATVIFSVTLNLGDYTLRVGRVERSLTLEG